MAEYWHGTAVYSPPEVLANAVGERTPVDRTKHDVYAVGVMLFEVRPSSNCPCTLAPSVLTGCQKLACVSLQVYMVGPSSLASSYASTCITVLQTPISLLLKAC